LATVQAEYLRTDALAWAMYGRDVDRASVLQIRRYLDAFLRSPEDAFYVSQDADLKPGEHSSEYFALDDRARRQRGIPRVDRHRYSLQNGQLIEALATWAELGGDNAALTQARRAAEWVLTNRALPNGGFRHDRKDDAGPYLGDTLAMGRAFLALYRATAERVWLERASAALDFIAANFKGAQGYSSAAKSGPITVTAQPAENISLTRFANLLARYTNSPSHRDVAKLALAYISQPRIALATITEPGILLAADEGARDPLHVTVVGAKSDPDAAALFASVQRLPAAYKRVEWWDKREGALPNPDVNYPSPKRAAAFVCTENRCSLPIFKPAEVANFIAESPRPSAIPTSKD